MGWIRFLIAAFLLFSTTVWAANKTVDKCELKLSKTQQLHFAKVSDPFREVVIESLLKTLPQLSAELNLDHEKIEALLALPPQFQMGQVAFPTFTLAKALKNAPPKIAAALAESINTLKLPGLERAEAVGPFVNFHMDFGSYAMQLLPAIENGQFFKTTLDNPEKISVEFSQPNTHKALHAGHMRNMVLGESISRLLEYSGHEVVRATYPGDLGAHIAKVLWYIKTQGQMQLPDDNRAQWLGEMYAKADAYLKEHANDETIKTEVAQVLRNIEERTGTDYKLYLLTREWSLEQMREVYAWLGIEFKNWFCESECDIPSRDFVKEKLAQGLLVQDNGAVGLDLKSENLGFVMMLKSDGSGLYLTKDLELLRQKFSDPSVTRSIVVVDERQRLHFQQVFRSAEILGIPNANKSIHLAYETVTDADGKAFSSRSLNGLSLESIQARLEKHFADYPRQNLAQATLKYGFLQVSPDNQIRFDLQEWLKSEGNSAVGLIQLADRLTLIAEVPGTVLPMDDLDKKILVHLGKFQSVAIQASRTFNPALLTQYLSDLKQLWMQHGGDQPTPMKQDLARASVRVLEKGLFLLGID